MLHYLHPELLHKQCLALNRQIECSHLRISAFLEAWRTAHLLLSFAGVWDPGKEKPQILHSKFPCTVCSLSMQFSCRADEKLIHIAVCKIFVRHAQQHSAIENKGGIKKADSGGWESCLDLNLISHVASQASMRICALSWRFKV